MIKGGRHLEKYQYGNNVTTIKLKEKEIFHMKNNYEAGNNGSRRFIMANGTLQTMLVFADTVRSVVESYLGIGYQVRLQQVTKNNGVTLTGLIIKNQESNLAPTIYLDAFYERYIAGERMAELCLEIIQLQENNQKTEDFDTSLITDFSKVSSRICYKLVNAERNRELLAEAPHKKFHDLAIIFYILVSQETTATATITVRNNLQELWGVGEDELFDLALQNTQRLFRGSVLSMENLFFEVAEELDAEETMAFYDMVVEDDGIISMYMASTQDRVQGAGVIFYDGLLQQFAESIQSDFYLLPSSIHEMIFVPVSIGISVAELKQIVRDMNAEKVAPEEVLSNHVYYYSRVLDRVDIL